MKGRKHQEKEERSARATGGAASEKGVKVSDSSKGANYYAGGDSNVADEADEPTGFKKGGKVPGFKFGKKTEDDKMKKKDGGSCDGDKAKHRLDRPKRAGGGKVATGSRSPFSEAESTSDRPKFSGT